MIIVELNDRRLIDNNNVDGFILGIKNISSECYLKLEIKEAKELITKIHSKNKLCFIDFTNMYHDQDKLVLEDTYLELKNADMFLYHDFMIHSIIKKEQRFYYSPTYNTNKFDILLSLEENNACLVSPELSFDELCKLNVPNTYIIGFGTWEIFHSRRPLISNYYKYRHWEYTGGNYEIVEEFRPNESYPIIEDNGTKIYLNGIYYLSSELEKLKQNLIIKTFNLPYDVVNRVLDIYKNSKNIDEELKTLNLSLNKGLLYEESILTKGGSGRE